MMIYLLLLNILFGDLNHSERSEESSRNKPFIERSRNEHRIFLKFNF